MKRRKYIEGTIQVCILVCVLALFCISWSCSLPDRRQPSQETVAHITTLSRRNTEIKHRYTTPSPSHKLSMNPRNRSNIQQRLNQIENKDPLDSALYKMPWIKQHNFLPNFFTMPANVSTRSYRDAVIVYVHTNKAAGTTTKNCMLKTLPKYGKHVWHVLTDCVRVSLKKSSIAFDALMGDYAFGVCDDLSRPCAYFTFVRDPYERTISSYSYCRRARMDQLCRALDAWKVSLNEWAIHQGSFFLRQLVFNPEFCFGFKEYYKRNIIANDLYLQTPVWFRERVILLNMLSEEEYEAIVNFTLEHFEEWFAFIGLTSKYDLSLEMLGAVFGVPFHRECSGMHDNHGGSYANLLTTETTGNNSLKHLSRSEVHRNMIETLKSDERVNEALSADLKLFLKANEIFEKQKVMFFKMKTMSNN